MCLQLPIDLGIVHFILVVLAVDGVGPMFVSFDRYRWWIVGDAHHVFDKST